MKAISSSTTPPAAIVASAKAKMEGIEVSMREISSEFKARIDKLEGALARSTALASILNCKRNSVR